MKNLATFFSILFLLGSCSGATQGHKSGGWISLFDGNTQNGWKASENPGTFTVEDSKIIVDGPRAHLFYVGPVQDAHFKNFELKTRVMTTPGSNSGIFIHTAYQEDGWPSQSYEVQVNNTHTDWRKTGSLYAVDDVREVLVKDNECFTDHIIVQDNKVSIKVNDKTVVEYTEPAEVAQAQGEIGRRLSSGTFALQGHNPESRVYYKEVLVKPLPE